MDSNSEQQIGILTERTDSMSHQLQKVVDGGADRDAKITDIGEKQRVGFHKIANTQQILLDSLRNINASVDKKHDQNTAHFEVLDARIASLEAPFLKARKSRAKIKRWSIMVCAAFAFIWTLAEPVREVIVEEMARFVAERYLHKELPRQQPAARPVHPPSD